MYLHVPSVWVAYLAFAVVLVASIVYLARRLEAADRLAYASAEVGVLFTGLTIATGSGASRPGAPGGRGTRGSRASRSCSSCTSATSCCRA